MGKTKKIWSAGRFGPRYGRRTKQRVIDIERKQKVWHKCPYCNKKKVKRVAIGIWTCRKCNATFTGRAYTPWE